jgi:N-acetylmuramoyl-L-alanine amidase
VYEVRFYRGDYLARQRQANAEHAKAYVEHHFNSVASPSAGYVVVITGSNASQTSRNWGRWYAQAIHREFGVPIGGDQGIKVGGFNGRGDANLRHTDMPAILLEPLFVSNPGHAEIVRSEDGQARLAQVLVDSIKRFFPDGGLIAFSVGHKYKTSNPADRGAPVVGGGSEADFAEQVLLRAKTMLEGAADLEERRLLRVVHGDRILLAEAIDEDAELVWDPERALLQIVG